MKDVTIRNETSSDYAEVENLVRESFWNVYRPGCLEHFVLHELRNDPNFVPELDFVLVKDGKIIGQNVFVKAAITGKSGKAVPVLTMGPICISKDLQGKGYGKYFLDFCLEKAKAMGFGAVCIEGSFDFYSKCGFKYAREYGVGYHGVPEGEDISFFLCNELICGYLDGVNGEYSTPNGYFVDESKVDEFDARFPHKEKLILEGQLNK